MNVEQATDARLQELRDVARSGVTERTGKAARLRSGSGDEERGRRVRGMRSSELSRLPLSDTPKKIAASITRGKGKVYRRIRQAVRLEMSKYFPEARKRSPGRPVIPAHKRMTKACKACGVAHSKSEHRFHGPGSFHRTHLFSFNPNMHGKTVILRRKRVRPAVGGKHRVFGRRVRKNPPDAPVKIYGRLLRIEAQKTQAHQCDPKCAAVNHRYFHDFKPGAQIFGLPNGDLWIKNRS